ncbi:TetR family transcriptional regulator [Micromonospora sp. RP3T]|uniref:TetR family transcriptional regulator n=1 Tax=Micromonospora sp. RP3T TaxID=2135446 RepID=UPI000D176F00|nr:TetR family transcriptional regulator [Micromonospora sp. RP3T]PTA47668.1 TetR/AcrR family transcriptional regulator [Micromonospora sp. RP3T]
MAVAERDGVRTRAKILELAQELFAERGYAGTSIADIARELGTSKAALYYHFKSKDELLGALITEPVSVYAALADRCRNERMSAEQLLGSLIDLTAATHSMQALLSNDPSIAPVLRRLYDVEGSVQTFVRALAGPDPTEAAWTRAWAAFAVAKQGTFWAVRAGDGTLTAAARAEFLAAALRCLDR